MSKTIQSKGELYLTENQFNNRDSAGTLEEGVVYNIIDPVGYATEEYVNEQISSRGSTQVTVGGSNVATFNADTKVDKVTTTSPYNRVYAITTQGKPVMINVTNSSASANSIAQRYDNGRLFVGTPVLGGDATTKKYVDNLVDNVDCVALQGNNLDSDGKLYIDWQSDLANRAGVCYDITTVGQFNSAGCPVITVGLPNKINLTSCHIDILGSDKIHINGTFTHNGSTTPIDEFYAGDLTGKKIFITPGTGTGYAIIRTRYINGII